MGRKRDVAFLVGAMIIGTFPLVGMTFFHTTETVEKRSLAKIPAITNEEGKLNASYLQDWGAYFEDHFALRNQMVAADSLVLSKVFHTSAVDTIIVGDQNWLYYTDSLDDYVGQNVISAREAYNIVHNIELMQECVETQGAQFMFTIAPNKNSLYGENMPYYDRVKAGTDNNYSMISKYLESGNVNYTDLFQAFQEKDKVLYCKQDSHWTGEGAVWAYNRILDNLGILHENYEETEILRTKSTVGDLAQSLYSVAAPKEWNGEYQYEKGYVFSGEGQSWEDGWIQTTSDAQGGNLLMFRDSFGNTLSPLMAEVFQQAAFAKNNVYLLDSYMEECHPRTVVAEIVERNLERFGSFEVEDQFSAGPPVMKALEINAAELGTDTQECVSEVRVMDSAIQPEYKVLYGEVDEELLDAKTEILLSVESQGNTKVYKAFGVSYEEQSTGNRKDNRYMLYLPAEEYEYDDVTYKVILKRT